MAFNVEQIKNTKILSISYVHSAQNCSAQITYTAEHRLNIDCTHQEHLIKEYLDKGISCKDTLYSWQMIDDRRS